METKRNSIVTAMLGQSILNNIISSPLVKKFHGAYQLQTHTGLAFLFNYATVVFWGVAKTERQSLLESLIPYVSDPCPEIIVESCSFNIDPTKPFSIHNDHITIPDASPIIRLALSHALAQSAKLIFFEDKAEFVIASNLDIPKKLAKTGKIHMGRKQLSQLRGTLFDTSCDITLNFSLLEKPNFFWDFPDLDDYYEKLSQYFEMTPRINVLNQKLSTIRELLDMLAAEQNHKHSSALELIIIILIALEIVLFLIGK